MVNTTLKHWVISQEIVTLVLSAGLDRTVLTACL